MPDVRDAAIIQAAATLAAAVIAKQPVLYSGQGELTAVNAFSTIHDLLRGVLIKS